MTDWLLIVWLCASPGPTGQCQNIEVRPMPSRGACMAARAAELRASVHIHAACRLDRGDFDDVPPGGAG